MADMMSAIFSSCMMQCRDGNAFLCPVPVRAPVDAGQNLFIKIDFIFWKSDDTIGIVARAPPLGLFVVAEAQLGLGVLHQIQQCLRLLGIVVHQIFGGDFQLVDVADLLAVFIQPLCQLLCLCLAD